MIDIGMNLSWDSQDHRRYGLRSLRFCCLCRRYRLGELRGRFTVCFTVAGRWSGARENPPQGRLTGRISPELIFLFAMSAPPECTHSMTPCPWLARAEYELKSIMSGRLRTSVGKSIILGIVRDCITGSP